MSKITLSDVGNLANESSARSTINANNDAIETAFENTLSRDGSTPNQMNADLDMNGNSIMNLPDALTDQEPVTLGQVTQLIAEITGDDSGEDSIQAQYVVLATHGELDNERVLTGGTNISIADGGAGGNVTVDISSAELNSLASSTWSTKTVPTGTVVGHTDTQTLTNKTVNLTSNTLSGTTAQFNTALSDGDFVTQAGSETLTNKTIALGSNTVSGTTAQFNTALSDGDFATLAGSETLTNKTISGASNTLTNIGGTSIRMGSDAQGDIMYFNGTNYVRLGAGTSGHYLKTQGAGANPTWAASTGTGDLVSTNNLSDVSNATTARSNLGVQYTLIESLVISTVGASNTWTKPSGTSAVEVWVVGGGGGGGGGDGDSGTASLSGGGGAGGIAYKWITSGLGGTETVAVGGGGLGGAAGVNPGATGGSSSFGAHCSATGGSGGTSFSNGSSMTWTAGGAGGIGSSGSLNIAGGPGHAGVRFSGSQTAAGEGGSNMFGGGGVNNNSGSAVGVAGRGYGGGGSGGSANTTTDRAGGDGAQGVVIVKSYKL